MIKISVIIAAYNGEKYIEEQLQSILRQTCIPDEILIGDDSPIPKIAELIEDKLTTDYTNIQYFHNPSQYGHINNFLNLMRKASGDLIFFCDQDDVWLPNKISEMKKLYIQTNADVLFCDSFICNGDCRPNGETLFHFKKNRKKLIANINQQQAFSDVFLCKLMLSGHNMVCTRKMLSVFENIPCNFPHYDFWFAIVAAAGGKLYLNDSPLTLYRRHAENISQLSITEKRSLIQYLNQQRKNDIVDSLNKYTELRDSLLLVSKYYLITEKNLRYAVEIADFFNKRLSFRSYPLYKKIFSLPISFLKQYFLYASGFRSLCRDIIEIP